MKVRTYIAAASAAALVGAGAFLLPAAASPQSTTHTLKYISVEKNSVDFSKTIFGVQDTDVNESGQAVGFDEIYFQGVSATSAAANVTVDTKGGFLYGRFTVNTNTGNVTSGKVTGGTGAFKGATGTFKAVGINKAGTRHAVTITYNT